MQKSIDLSNKLFANPRDVTYSFENYEILCNTFNSVGNTRLPTIGKRFMCDSKIVSVVPTENKQDEVSLTDILHRIKVIQNSVLVSTSMVSIILGMTMTLLTRS